MNYHEELKKHRLWFDAMREEWEAIMMPLFADMALPDERYGREYVCWVQAFADVHPCACVDCQDGE